MLSVLMRDFVTDADEFGGVCLGFSCIKIIFHCFATLILSITCVTIFVDQRTSCLLCPDSC